MTIWKLWDEANAEVKADIDNLTNERYILKLEQYIGELKAAKVNDAAMREEMIKFIECMNTINVLNGQTIVKIKLVRAAFNLGLKEAKELVEQYPALPF
jgi:ribosomal protein L7/L12